MAEETPKVKNKGLLIVALVLAAVVAVVYNIHIIHVRKAARGKTVKVLAFRRNMEPNEVIKSIDLEPKELAARWIEGLGDVVCGEDADPSNFRKVYDLKEGVTRGLFLRWSHIGAGKTSRPSQAIDKGMIAFPLEIDSRLAPGTICSVGDRVMVIGTLSVKGDALKAYSVIEGVRVLAIGGVAGRPLDSSDGRKRLMRQTAQRSYRSILIEVTPETGLQLTNVLSHVVGPVRIAVMHSTAGNELNLRPQVLDELRGLNAAPPRRLGQGSP